MRFTKRHIFLSRASIHLQVIAGLVFTIVLLGLDDDVALKISINNILEPIAAPISTMASLPSKVMRDVDDTLATKETLQDENQQLLAENQQLHATITRLTNLREENSQLRQLLKSTTQQQYHYQLATLLSVSLAPTHLWFGIDQGKEDGIRKNWAVVDAYGLVGQVIQLNDDDSVVMQIGDIKSAIPVEVGEQSWRAIAVGTGHVGRLTLIHVPDTAKIAVGDEVKVSSLAPPLPAGYKVGYVTSVKRSQAELFSDIEVASYGRMGQSHLVMVVKPTTGAAKHAQKKPVVSPEAAHA